MTISININIILIRIIAKLMTNLANFKEKYVNTMADSVSKWEKQQKPAQESRIRELDQQLVCDYIFD